MNNNIKVGTINGSNNNFNQKNVYNGGGGKKPGGDSDGNGGAAILGFFGLTVVAEICLLTNYESAFFWLKLITLTSGAVHLLALLPQIVDESYSPLDSLAPSAGIVLTVFLAGLLSITFNALPDELFAIALRPTAAHGFLTQKIEIWARFDSEQQRLILDNLMSTAFLAVGALVNVGFGMQCLLASLGQAYRNSICARAAQWLRLFRIGGAAIVAFAAMASFLSVSGVLSGHLGS